MAITVVLALIGLIFWSPIMSIHIFDAVCSDKPGTDCSLPNGVLMKCYRLVSKHNPKRVLHNPAILQY